MSDCEYNLKDCGCAQIIQTQNHHSASSPIQNQQSKSTSSSSASSSAAKSVDKSCTCSSSPVVGERGGGSIITSKSIQVDDEKTDLGVTEESTSATNSISSLVPLPPGSNNNSNKSVSNHQHHSTPSSGCCRYCLSKMFTCRVLIVLLLVKCLILSFIIPAHLIPTSSSEYPPHDPDNGSNGNGDHHSAGDEDGFDNIILLDDQPISLTLKTEIMNLVENFDIPSHTVAPSDTTTDGGTVEEPTAATTDSGGAGDGQDDDDKAEGGDDNDGDDNGKDDSTESTTNGDNAGTDADGAQGEDAEEASEAVEPTTEASSAEGSASVESDGGGSCSGSSMKTVLDKIESLMDAVKNIDSSIDKMETLVQSTMIDERVYKCMSAISNGNQTQAQKYWKQILRYLSTPQKQAAILNQLIRDSYGGSEDQILPVIQFIDQTTQYYGYYTLFKELKLYNHLYKNTAIFTLGHFIKKSCGRDSALYKSLPGAVQSVLTDFFTLQNKYNKGYLYYAKRCVAKHYFHCLDVLTKRIDPYVLDGLADDSEEKKRYHWKLNATDSTVTKFFILNHDKYWTYRLQDLNNSPRFKMEEAGSNAEIELAHFQLKLHSDDEIIIQVRDSEDYLEEEDFKSDKAEVRLHSFHQADGIPDSPRMYWLANAVASSVDDGVDEPASCNIDLASVPSPNGNGNGNSK